MSFTMSDQAALVLHRPVPGEVNNETYMYVRTLWHPALG